jgi:hypothetical protein
MLSVPTIFDASTGYAQPSGMIFYSGHPINGTYYRPYDTLPAAFYTNPKVDYKCYPDPVYQWGFVIGWVVIIFPLYCIWVLGMYVLWMDAQHNSSLV